MTLNEFEPFINLLDILVESFSTECQPSQESLTKILAKPYSFLVSASLIRNSFSYAKAVMTLIKTGGAEATAPLYRSIYEILLEIKNLLEHGNSEENSAKFVINSALDVEEFIGNSRFKFEEIFSWVKEVIKFNQDNYPDIYSQIEKQRKKKNFNWSNESRSKVERKVFDQKSSLYKVMSWEAHSLLTPVNPNNLKLIKDGEFCLLKFGSYDPTLTDAGFIAFLVTGILIQTIETFQASFGCDVLDIKEVGRIREQISEIAYKELIELLPHLKEGEAVDIFVGLMKKMPLSERQYVMEIIERDLADREQ